MSRSLPPECLFEIIVIRQSCEQIGSSDGHRVALRLREDHVQELVQTDYEEKGNGGRKVRGRRDSVLRVSVRIGVSVSVSVNMNPAMSMRVDPSASLTPLTHLQVRATSQARTRSPAIQPPMTNRSGRSERCTRIGVMHEVAKRITGTR